LGGEEKRSEAEGGKGRGEVKKDTLRFIPETKKNWGMGKYTQNPL